MEPGRPLLPASPEDPGNSHTCLQSIPPSSEATTSSHHLRAAGSSQRQHSLGVTAVERLKVVQHPRHLNTLTMADPWLAHEVLRELDEAGAAYFALAMREPASSNNLVKTILYPIGSLYPAHMYISCWMDMGLPSLRFVEEIAEPRITGCTDTQAYSWRLLDFCQYSHCEHEEGRSQEIPAAFTAETGWPGTLECALVTSISSTKEWPVRLRRCTEVEGGVSAVAVGGGWAKFLVDQRLPTGALLTFEPVDSRCLVVALHERSAAEDSQLTQHTSMLVEAISEPGCGDIEPPPVPNSVPLDPCQCGRTEGAHESRPQFTKTLRKTHLKSHDAGRLVSS